jgi:Domain of unknown function (DUF397)
MTGSRGWFKSSFSNPTGDCVEVRYSVGAVRVRDSKGRGEIALSGRAWSTFIAGVDQAGVRCQPVAWSKFPTA